MKLNRASLVILVGYFIGYYGGALDAPIWIFPLAWLMGLFMGALRESYQKVI